MNRIIIIISLVILSACNIGLAQVGTNGDNRDEAGRPIKEYALTIGKKIVTLAGVTANGMTINGGIPGPILEFTEGDLAVINVTNNMDVETSMHWHGIILPNFFDGVPYLTTPPIRPGTTFQYRIPINQTGTYWYHSHTMLQEQKGVYGSIVIHPKEKKMAYDKDLVILLSDWTNEKSENVLRNLKRGNEWYQVKKGTSVPLSRAIGRGAFGAQLKMWRDRMEGADIADIYYPAFLNNGENVSSYPEFKPGEKVRLRFINASASTYFWVDFGGGQPIMVSSDGIDIVPVAKNRFLFAIAETYDIVVTIPNGKLEIIATAQDGSGYTTIHLGEGELHSAKVIERPDKIAMMQHMAQMDMKMGAPSIIGSKSKNTPEYLKEKYGMKMDMHHEHMNMDADMEMDSHDDHDHMNHQDNESDMPKDHMQMDNAVKKDSSKTMDHSKHMNMDHDKMKEHQNHTQMDHTVTKDSSETMDHSKHMNMNHDKMEEHHNHAQMDNAVKKDSSKTMDHSNHMNMNHSMDQPMKHSQKTKMDTTNFDHMARQTFFNYEFLKAKEETTFPSDLPVNELLFNLTGNMNRYVWSINGIPLSETDKIKIKQGEITRITLNNLTMMHHPMHLHGHFFRVLNKNGERSPLKHTVNVPPMQEVTIEFYNEEYGDWFFHCHVLYHMMSGMTRIFSYDTPRDARMDMFPDSKIIKEADMYFNWGAARLGSNFNEIMLTSTNIRNEFTIRVELDYDKNGEVELIYNRYLNDWVRLYAGMNAENESPDSFDDINTVALIGVKYFTPYMFNVDLSIDHQLRPRIRLDRELLLFPRIFIEGEYEYRADFGLVNDFEDGTDYEGETEWLVSLSYILSRNFSLQGNYNNQYGWGGGLLVRF